MVITETATDIAAHPAGLAQRQAAGPSGSRFSGDGGRPLGTSDDLELMTMPSVVGRESGEHDPLLLRDKIISGEAIDGLKHRKKGKKLADFYQAQNEHIAGLLKPLAAHTAEGEQDAKDMALKVKLAVNISFFANCALAVLQLYSAISSLSLALFATATDSVDPLANLILWLAHRASVKAEEKKWPVRGTRFQTSAVSHPPDVKIGPSILMSDPSRSGNVVFGSIMIAVNLILICFSVQEFITFDGNDTQEFHLIPTIVVCIVWGVKFALFCYCYAIKGASSQVQVLWEDHRNDLFSNAFGILTSAGGAKLAWWLDPMGASIIAIGVSISWIKTNWEQYTFLAGIAAPAEFQNLVTYKAMTFSDEIVSVDTCRVYHSGPNYFVEVDIVLPPEMPLWKAHDISQDLQDQIEALPDVDRCFVHVDHEVDHKPEHRKKV